MIEEADVITAYRLILGREPESTEGLKFHAERHQSLAELGRAFMASPEFQTKYGMRNPQPGDGGHIDVEVTATPDQLARMAQLIEADWAKLGETEPHWSVLTHGSYKSETIEANKDEFFSSGESSAKLMLHAADRCGVNLSKYRNCFELGCGVGRVTTWLAGMFGHVVGADISASHLELARQTMKTEGINNVELLHLNRLAAIDQIAPMDVFYSVIVLQHNPPPIMAYLLDRILSKLQPGGVAYFQIPTYQPGYSFSTQAYLNAPRSGNMETHIYPQTKLLALLEAKRCRVLEIREDGWVRHPVVSNSVMLQKRIG